MNRPGMSGDLAEQAEVHRTRDHSAQPHGGRGAIIDWASEASAALLAAELFPGTTPTEAQQRNLRTAGELQTRLVLSFVLTPHTTLNRSTPAALPAYVLDFILPLITGWNRPPKASG